MDEHGSDPGAGGAQGEPAGAADIALAAAALRAGGLVILPTETVYGLAADAANPRAV
ncbi:MAG: Sua5/YciO/YrdC/YwlC family protein, partial [Phenylobacterium sp.]